MFPGQTLGKLAHVHHIGREGILASLKVMYLVYSSYTTFHIG